MTDNLYARQQSTRYPLCGNIQVTAPTSARLMTPFVLQEQGDWFEDEMAFIRAFIRPGMQVIDIGANYGLYALTIAKRIGETGKLWAFEPTAFTADCLAASIADNQLGNIELIRAGLSDRPGKAKLFTTPNTELNSLTKASTPGTHAETITLLTLDHCHKRFDWHDIDFIKLDAEGEENNILKKAKISLTELSPLIMFELKHGQQVNLPLMQRFKSLGYDTYRLLPGLNCLTPFSADEDFDSYLLNLFCCKPDRALQLEATGFLVRPGSTEEAFDITKPDMTESTAHLAQLAYSESLFQLIDDHAWRSDGDYLQVVQHFALAQVITKPMIQRHAHLMTAWQKARCLLENGEQDFARLATFARIAFDVGSRNLGMQILTGLLQRHQNTATNIDIHEPLFPACREFDNVAPHANTPQALKHWLLASVLTQFVEKHAYSSYFSGRLVLPQLQLLEKLGYLSQRLETRRRLIETYFPA